MAENIVIEESQCVATLLATLLAVRLWVSVVNSGGACSLPNFLFVWVSTDMEGMPGLPASC